LFLRAELLLATLGYNRAKATAHPSLGVSTLAELTAKVEQQPGLRFGTGSGAGSLQAMVGLWYAKLADVVLIQVPYRGGGPAITDLIA
jgi:tripartite-type tricarboxylate transporter receptor subunit TctC